LPERTRVVGLPELGGLLGPCVVWGHPARAAAVAERLAAPVIGRLEEGAGAQALVVVGGGTRIDRAKWVCRGQMPGALLAAVPTLWGSGAEVSPVAVLNEREAKAVHVGDALRPDFAAYVDAFATDIPLALLESARGDVWAHALEGFLSPLGSDATRAVAADLLRRLLAAPGLRDPAWFRLSGEACLAQAATSVGLVHAIAHELEMPLAAAGGRQPAWSHAALCAAFLLPCFRYALSRSAKAASLLAAHDLDTARIDAACAAVFDAASYRRLLPALAENWGRIVRNPLARMNVASVREASGAFFQEFPGP
jgi:alcohol dehydrogenase class IV